MGLGISLTVKSNLGTTPMSSFTYVLSLQFSLTFGQFTFLLSLFYFILEILILRREFPRGQYAQIFIIPIFGYFVDLGMYVFSAVDPDAYLYRVITLLAACAILAMGVYLQVIANVLINPGEGVVKIVAEKTGVKFGNIKIMLDSSLAVIAIITSLYYFGSIIGIREGTVVSAILVGYFTKIYDRIYQGFIRRKLGGQLRG